MVKVNDDWCPNYPKHEVHVHLFIDWYDYDNSGAVIFVISGMDDTCVERRFKSSNLDVLIQKYEEWKIFYNEIPQTTNQRWYLQKGFQYG